MSRVETIGDTLRERSASGRPEVIQLPDEPFFFFISEYQLACRAAPKAINR